MAEKRLHLLDGIAAVLQRIKLDNMGFVDEDDLATIAEARPMQMLLVRCGNGRFLAPAQDVAHFVEIIEKSGTDHVRDVSLPA